ncbi:MAG: sensor histidine kinase [Eubacteriales bacterium]|nr:sensor histidine kinase [Eubacteriales bacterium]
MKLIERLLKNRRILPRKTIQLELLIAFICVSMIPVFIVNVYYYKVMSTLIGDKVKDYNTEIISQVGQKVDTLVSMIDIAKVQAADFLITSEDLAKYDSSSPSDKVAMVKSVENLLSRIQYSFNSISYVYLLLSDGHIYTINPNCDKARLAEKQWIKNAEREEFWDIVVPTHNADYYNIYKPEEQVPVVSFIKKITWYGREDVVGIIQVDMKYTEIQNIIENVDIGSKSSIVVCDSNDNIIYCPDENFLGGKLGDFDPEGYDLSSIKEYSEGRKMRDAFSVEYSLSNADWKVIGYISTEELYLQYKSLTDISLIIMFAMLFMSVLISYFLSKGITRPITRVMQKMKMVGEGKLEIYSKETKNADLQILTDSYNSMVKQIGILMNGIAAKEKEKNKMELTALQAQINPHFLYNTLNSIKWLAEMDKPNQTIVHAIMSLGKILRYSYQSGDSLVKIRDELDFLENYIFIQRIRYGEGIKVEININEELNNFSILKFTLQPIIENSIIHGFAGMNPSGNILLNGNRSGDTVIFEIIDDGVGVSLDNREKFTGLGMDNVNSRIKMNFGEEYGLKMESSPGKGTKVTITIPVLS